MAKSIENQVIDIITDINDLIKSKFNASLHYEIHIKNNKFTFNKWINGKYTESYIDNAKASELLPIVTILYAVLTDL